MTLIIVTFGKKTIIILAVYRSRGKEKYFANVPYNKVTKVKLKH